MDRLECWQVVDEQRGAIADLLETLTEDEWSKPTWCTAWTVRDLAAHLSLAATAGPGEVLRGLVRARGDFDRMIRDLSVARAAVRTDAEIIVELRGLIGSRRLAPGTFTRDPMLDLLVHGQDLARPLGRSLPMPVGPARESVEWAWQRGFPFLPAKRLRGVRLVADDTEWARGEGPEVRGPVADLLMLSCGRRQVLTESSGLGGPGLAVLAGVGVE